MSSWMSFQVKTAGFCSPGSVLLLELSLPGFGSAPADRLIWFTMITTWHYLFVSLSMQGTDDTSQLWQAKAISTSKIVPAQTGIGWTWRREQAKWSYWRVASTASRHRLRARQMAAPFTLSQNIWNSFELLVGKGHPDKCLNWLN